MKKQLDYANKKKIPYVILAGENEMKEGKLTVKDMQTGEQNVLTWEEIMKKLGNMGIRESDNENIKPNT
jgi:histidyl-tRNA synthetase